MSLALFKIKKKKKSKINVVIAVGDIMIRVNRLKIRYLHIDLNK